MPIIYIHGVGTRQNQLNAISNWTELEANLRTTIAPKIAADPQNVAITAAYWGDIGVGFAWGGMSRPPQATGTWNTHPIIQTIASGEFSTLMQEALHRGGDLPGHLATRAADSMRGLLNEQVTLFFGDVFTYLAHRGTAQEPGLIPRRILDLLEIAHLDKQNRGGEPLIVFSHSMGGQIIYDIVTHFLPQMPRYAGISIDFWGATASQVGLFEEMKLFLVSDPSYGIGNLAPFPSRRHLGYWWNVWDPNDFLSFTVKDIIAEVDDEFYDSGMPVTEAHTGLFQRSTFFQLFAAKLDRVIRKPTLQAPHQIIPVPDLQSLIRTFNAVHGMTPANLLDVKYSNMFLKLTNKITIRIWANSFNVLHVFLVNETGKCVYGGFVGWIDTDRLRRLLETLKQRHT